MKKMAVLGPKGTYCDIAASKFILDGNHNYEIEYFDSILKTANAVSNDFLATVPFENTLDGFVLEALDSISNKNNFIIKQLKLPVDFAFVSNENDVKNVKKVYCQFKAEGQCLEFINEYDFTIEKTNSNTETYNKVKDDNSSGVGAIIPMHLLKNEFALQITHIADLKNNETRFVLLDKKLNYDIKDNFDASIMVTFNTDRPGLLYEMSKIFHELNINMKTIMSRPLKTEIGKYKFYIEASFNKDDISLLNELLDRLNKDYRADLLGIYNSL